MSLPLRVFGVLMKIRTTDVSLRGQKIDVRGQIYAIDAQGEVVVSEEHSAILLGMPGWDAVAVTEKVEDLKDQLVQMDEIALVREARMAQISVVGKSKEQLAEDVATRRRRRKD
jgi:hypothetical protein